MEFEKTMCWLSRRKLSQLEDMCQVVFNSLVHKFVRQNYTLLCFSHSKAYCYKNKKNVSNKKAVIID